MRLPRILLLILVGLVMSIPTQAQNYSIENSLEFVIEGILHHDKEEYKSAIKAYNKVHRNDTNYVLALYERSLTELAMDNNDACIATCQEGIGQKPLKLEYQFYVNYGTAYSNKDEFDRAIEVYDSAIAKYPYNSSLKYNKAIALLKAKRYEDGLNLLYDNIRENPYHANSHLTLAKICRDLELHSQALMSFVFYLTMQDHAPSGLEYLQYIDNYVSGDMAGEGEYSDIDFLSQGFEEVDELISNKVAVSDRYETSSDLSFPVIKQTHLLLSSFKLVDADEGFWHEYYVPFFKKLMKSKQFEGFSYYLVRSAAGNNPDIEKIISRNSSKKDRFVDWYGNNFKSFFGMHEVDGKEIEYHYSNGDIIAIGDFEDGQYNGDWQFFHSSGCLSGEGKFIDSKRDGKWLYYYENGALKRTNEYDNGVVSGPFVEYSEKGYKSKEGKYKNDYFDGIITEYYPTGGIYSTQEYEVGHSNGALIYFHRNGEKSLEAHLDEGVAKGDVVSYASNGQKTLVRPFVNGSVNGRVRSWYLDGAIKTEIEYQDDKYHGSYKSYHRNGKVAEESEYKEGMQIGESKEYFDNGQLEREVFLDESGKLTGTTKSYYEDGSLFSEFYYKKGAIIGYKYLNKDGSVLKEVSKKGKYLEFEGYDLDGYVFRTGMYVKGERDGTWKGYDPLKILTSKREYEDGQQAGGQEFFYNNGQKQRSYSAENDNAEGEFIKYDRNGKEINTGYYSNDNEKGEFLWKNNFGNITARTYYKEGSKEGWQTYYTEDGILSMEEYYDNGSFLGGIYYDSAGQNGTKVWLEGGSGDYTLKYPNGQARYVAHYTNGILNGKVTWYYPDGSINSTGEYLNGQEHGEWLSYYENGQLHSKKTYYSGSREGEYIDYFENGEVETKATYKYGDLVGTYERYYWNGKMRYKSEYKNGQLHGIQRRYAPTGDLSLIRRYVRGVLVGYSYLGKDGKEVEEMPITGKEQTVVAYFQNGQKSVEFTIKSDYYLNTFTWYYPSGKVYRKSSYKDGMMHGQLIAYQEDGKLLYDYGVKYGEWHGSCKDYYLNGELKNDETFFNGDQNGISTYYDKSGKLISKRYYFDGKFYGGNYK